MREIRFRGLRTDGRGWVYGWYWEDSFSEKAFILTGVYVDKKWSDLPLIEQIQVDSATVGQFIGLYDMNGVEIYEGDKVTSNLFWDTQKKEPVIFVIKYLDCGFSAVDNKGGVYVMNSNVEVVGNIHEVKK